MENSITFKEGKNLFAKLGGNANHEGRILGAILRAWVKTDKDKERLKSALSDLLPDRMDYEEAEDALRHIV